MSPRNSLLMAIALVIVAVFIFRFEIPEGERIDRESFVMRKVADDKITKVALSGEKGSVVFVRSSEGDKPWKLEDAPDAVLDTAAVNGIFSALQTFKSGAVIPASEQASDPAVYGLTQSPLRLDITMENGRTVIEFGKTNAFLQKRYARITGVDNSSALILADDVLYKAASKSRSDFREKNPIQFSDSDLSSVTAEWGGQRIVLVQTDTDWEMKEPLQTGADASAILSMVREVRGFKAVDFIDGVTDLERYKLKDPTVRIEFSFRDVSRKPLIVTASAADVTQQEGKTEGGAYFSTGGSTVYRTADNVLIKVVKPLKDFRQKQLFTFAVDEVQKVEVEESDGKTSSPPLTIVNDGKVWRVNGQEGDTVFVMQLLNDIASIEAVDFPRAGEASFGFENPVRSFKLFLKDGAGKESTRELLIGSHARIPSGGRGSYVADGAHKEAAFIVADAVIEKLTPKLETLKKSDATPAPL